MQDAASVLTDRFSEVLERLPAGLDLDSLALESKAIQRRREVVDGAALLRIALARGPGGLSLRQTVVRAEALGWARLSDVALLKRLRASANWLETLCWGLWSHWKWPTELAPQGRRWRIVDATTAQEPGVRGISWRVHYVIGLPSLACDFVSVTLPGWLLVLRWLV